MKMTGIVYPNCTSLRCSSIPVSPGMLTSRTRHDVRSAHPDDRYASADAKARQFSPAESRRSMVAERTNASSSITEITCIVTCMPQTAHGATHEMTRERATVAGEAAGGRLGGIEAG